MSELLATTAGVSIKNQGSLITLTIGVHKLTSTLMAQAQGEQPYRTQYDIALDGKPYIVGAGKALGVSSFVLLDGPFLCDSKEKSTLNTLKTMQKLADRKITITIPTAGGNTQFTGYVTKFTIELDDQLSPGSYYIWTGITAQGVWA
jgi:hypothetical protein